MNKFRGCVSAQQHGFSLLEVLVAFAILALAVATILSLFASGLRNTAVAADYARALTLAESQLAILQGREAVRLVSGDSEGSTGGFNWHSRISPYEDAVSDTSRTRLYRIDVSVKWGEGAHQRSVRLSTLRIGQAP